MGDHLGRPDAVGVKKYKSMKRKRKKFLLFRRVEECNPSTLLPLGTFFPRKSPVQISTLLKTALIYLKQNWFHPVTVVTFYAFSLCFFFSSECSSLSFILHIIVYLFINYLSPHWNKTSLRKQPCFCCCLLQPEYLDLCLGHSKNSVYICLINM